MANALGRLWAVSADQPQPHAAALHLPTPTRQRPSPALWRIQALLGSTD